MQLQEALRIVEDMNILSHKYQKGKIPYEHYISKIALLNSKVVHTGRYTVACLFGEYVLEHLGVR